MYVFWIYHTAFMFLSSSLIFKKVLLLFHCFHVFLLIQIIDFIIIETNNCTCLRTTEHVIVSFWQSVHYYYVLQRINLCSKYKWTMYTINWLIVFFILLFVDILLFGSYLYINLSVTLKWMCLSHTINLLIEIIHSNHHDC